MDVGQGGGHGGGLWPRFRLVAHGVLGALSVPVLGLMALGGAHAWQVAAAALAAVALHASVEAALRRPAAGFALASQAMLGLVLTPMPGRTPSALPSAACFLVVLWRIAATSRRLRAAALPVAAAGVVISGSASWTRLPGDMPAWTPAAQGVFELGAVAAVWAGAVAAARRRERAARAERERVEAARSAERARIRRDLHDVIAHSITVMVARVDAAAVTAGDKGTREELEDVAESGRDALGALRAMLAVLDAGRPDRGEAPPTLGALPELVRAATTPLHRVVFEEEGARTAVALDAEAAIVRVAQEGITNAFRHLRPPVAVTVHLQWRETGVLLRIRDDGGRGGLDTGPAGTGLAGARERVEAAGGVFSADPEDSGWVLTARLPTKEQR
ncbi:sensor histidine kinase [Nocardiopsis suaedae]|uniref:histidine kinase n=1 Tax=Nocardiopsis suaedae TaxID=3018444 RepID=A0ABT4TI49_9ACTN|nr:histidine kinase [Nocardiopsis suaedae]MDA2804384.1 histidine kinase [Nocardiopsis suaedae]